MGDRRVVVTGLGVVSPIGVGAAAFRAALLRGANGAGPITLLDASRLPVSVAAEVRGFDDALVPGDHRYHRVMSRAMKFAVVAAAEAVAAAGLDAEDLADAACVAGVGRHDMTVAEFGPGFARALAAGPDGAFAFDRAVYLSRGVRAMHPLWLLTFIPNLAVSHVGAATGLRGEANTLTTEGASGLQAIAEAAASIREGVYDVALCGACDARVTPIGLVRSLAAGKLARSDRPDESRPFDASRRGFVLGEGAAFFVLEEAGHALARGARALAEVAGWGEACDAYHPHLAHPEGRGLAAAMRAALARAGAAAGAVDLVVACASSLPDLDAAESAAIGSVFGDAAPAVTAPAGALGRAHAASGALAAAAALGSLLDQSVPPTINTTEPMPGAPAGLAAGGREGPRRLRAALANAWAFGGESASVMFSEASS